MGSGLRGTSRMRLPGLRICSSGITILKWDVSFRLMQSLQASLPVRISTVIGTPTIVRTTSSTAMGEAPYAPRYLRVGVERLEENSKISLDPQGPLIVATAIPRLHHRRRLHRRPQPGPQAIALLGSLK